MRFRTDDRGVTVQIGTVLLFAVLIILLSTYQASVVPQQNEQVEFNHNQQVQNQLQDLRDELLRTAATGSGGSSSVALGTQYPVRAVFVNPASPSGTLRTTTPANVTIENASATGETGDYWTGSAHNFSTRGLTYDPIYHVYQNPPTTVYDNSVLYNRFDGANRTLAEQRLVQGNRISLVALNGTFSKSSSRTQTVGMRAVSPATRTVTVRNDSSNVSVVLPTTLPADEWEDLLESELNETEGDDRYVLAVEDGPRPNSVTILLEPGTYELELAKVGVGTGVTGVDPHYVTDVEGDGESVVEDSTQKLSVEVRDRYNNPVSGASVNATLVSDLSGDTIAAQGQTGDVLTDLQTDGEGRVTLAYDPSEDFDGGNEPVEVRVSTNETAVAGPAFDPGARTNLSFNLTAVNADGSGLGGDGGGGGGGGGGAFQTQWDVPRIDAEPGMTCYANDTCRYDQTEGVSVTMTAETIPVADNATLDFAVNDTGIGAFNVSNRNTNSVGRAQVSLDTSTTGNVTVYTSGGGSGDAIAVDVYESGGGGGGGDGAAESIEIEVQGSNSGGSGKVGFTLRNNGTKDATIVGIAINNTTTAAEEVSKNDILIVDGTQVVNNPIPIDNSGPDGTRVSVDNTDLLIGESRQFEFDRFQDPDATGSANVNMAGSEVYVTLFFSDGTQTTIVLNVS